jgi:tetratricopeptide (TPR) repeat protein
VPPRHLVVRGDPREHARTPLLVPVIDADCRLRGPYTAGGTLARALAPAAAPALVAEHDLELRTVAPELAVPVRRETLYNQTPPAERTRIHSRYRTGRIAHGLIDFLHGCLPAAPHTLVLDNVDRADPTDRELIAALLRRTDPARLTVVVGTTADLLDLPADVVRPAAAKPEPELEPAEHDARADELAAGDWSWRLGAIPYHRERGTDPRAAVEALRTAVEHCYGNAFHHACVDLARRGRARTEPGSPVWWEFTRRLAGSLTLLGRGVDAGRLYDEACAAGEDPAVHHESAYSKAMLYARHLDPKLQDQRRALRYVNQAIAHAGHLPDPAERRFFQVFYRNGKALIRMRLGEPESALALVDQGLAELRPDEHRIDRCSLLSNRARLLIALGRNDEALSTYGDLIAVDPDYAEYHFDRANLLYALGRNAEARADYDEAVRLGPPFPELHYNRAVLLRAEDDPEAALRDLDRVLDLDPAFVDAYLDRAEVREAIGDVQGAASDVAAGLTLDPANRFLTCLRGRLAAAAGDFDAARAAYNEALALDPAFPAALAGRAALSYDIGDPAAAVADLTRALATEEDPALLYNRAMAQVAAGRAAEARADAHRALTLDPADQDAAQLLADLERAGS